MNAIVKMYNYASSEFVKLETWELIRVLDSGISPLIWTTHLAGKVHPIHPVAPPVLLVGPAHPQPPAPPSREP